MQSRSSTGLCIFLGVRLEVPVDPRSDGADTRLWMPLTAGTHAHAWGGLPCLACNHGRGSVGCGWVRSHASFECLGGSGGRLPAAVSEGCGDRILSAKRPCLVPLQDLSLAGGCQTVIGTRSHAASHALGLTFCGGHHRSPGIETAGHLEVDFWVESLPPRWRPLCQS